MITLIIWFAAFLCPNPNHTISDLGKCKMVHSTTNGFDTGGETGGNPPPPPPPPPPGGGG